MDYQELNYKRDQEWRKELSNRLGKMDDKIEGINKKVNRIDTRFARLEIKVLGFAAVFGFIGSQLKYLLIYIRGNDG